jgi:hypothetical protein
MVLIVEALRQRCPLTNPTIELPAEIPMPIVESSVVQKNLPYLSQ